MHQVVQYFEYYAQRVPLEVFVFVGTFIEEVIAPIPSFFVMLPAGAAAAAQGHSPWYLLILMVFSAAGRIPGALILYWLASKLEGALFGKGRTFFGVSQVQVEQFGQRFGKSGWQDWGLLFVANAMPMFPGVLLSVGCGFIKMRLSIFITATFFGSMITALFYLLLGYGGIAIVRVLREARVLSIVGCIILVALLALALVRWRMHGKNSSSAKTS